MKFTKGFIVSGLITSLFVVSVVAFVGGADVEIKHGDDVVASSICGIMYTADPENASRADFQLLLQEVRAICQDDELGAETNHRHPDGALKHAVFIDNNCCVVNWELSQVAALKAYEDVCLNRNP